MNVRLALVLLHWFSRLLTEQKRRDKLPRWIPELERSPRPVRYAFSILPAAILIALHTPFIVKPSDVVKVKRADKVVLRALRSSVVLMGFTAVLIDVLTLAAGALDAPGIAQWLLGIHLFLGYAYGLAWFGLGVDCPWLRMTRLGSTVMLTLVVGPIIWIATGHGMPNIVTQLWLLASFTAVLWDSYWAVARPLRKRGVFSR